MPVIDSRMRKKKPPAEKKLGKKNSASPKQATRRKKATRSKGASGCSSAQVHQGVGPETSSQSVTAAEIPDLPCYHAMLMMIKSAEAFDQGPTTHRQSM
jgi:hypothetical protein